MEPREPSSREIGYRAGGRLKQESRRRTPGTILGLAAIVLAGLAFSALDRDDSVPSGSGRSVPSSDMSSVTTAPSFATAVPDFAILAQPAPSRPVPIHAGWLRWLDPTSAQFVAAADPPEEGSRDFTFVDAQGNAIQVCVPAPTVGDSATYEVRLCSPRQPQPPLVIATFDAPTAYLDIAPDRALLQLDATVARDGRTLWLASAVHLEGKWIVEVRAIDIAGWFVRAKRELRRIQVTRVAAQQSSPAGWRIDPDAILKPTIRASPSGTTLSVTLTASKPFEPGSGLLQQERMVLPSSLDPESSIEIAFPFGAAGDLACDPSRGAWATERHYVTLCRHGGYDGTTQPFVRIENPGDMTRDVEVGPPVGAFNSGTGDGSSWLLDGDRGILYRWATGLTLSALDVATRAGSTIELAADGSPPAGGIAFLPGGVGSDGDLAWMQLATAGSPDAGLELAGSGDGRYLYATGRADGVSTGESLGLRTIEWVLDTTSNVLVGRADAPGPFDQIALGPGGGPLLGMVTPGVSAGPPGPASDWDAPLWFVDHVTGQPLEVIGHLHGPAGLQPWLLSPIVGRLAGF